MTPEAVSFDCFGTLVNVPRPEDPARAVADGLRDRGVAVPADWADAYVEHHIEVAEGAELSLVEHTQAALASRGVDADESVVADAVLDAFDREPDPLPGAADLLAGIDRPVGVLSNCAVPGLVPRMLSRADLSGPTDTVVTSVELGWRKPDRRAFAAVAAALGTAVDGLAHAGDKPEADGGIDDYGGVYLPVDGDLTETREWLADAGVME